jgi:hypothetical protein
MQDSEFQGDPQQNNPQGEHPDQLHMRPKKRLPERRFMSRRTQDHFLFKPARRIYVTMLAIVLILAFVAGFFGMQAYFNRADLRACEKINGVRREMNARIPEHVRDAHNLVRLLDLNSRTRGNEEKAWTQIEKLFKGSPNAHTAGTIKLENDINDLILAFKDDLITDSEIDISERHLRFNYLPIVNCSKTL